MFGQVPIRRRPGHHWYPQLLAIRGIVVLDVKSCGDIVYRSCVRMRGPIRCSNVGGTVAEVPIIIGNVPVHVLPAALEHNGAVSDEFLPGFRRPVEGPG